MKSVHSEQFYEKYQEEFLKKVPGETYMNLEEDLHDQIQIYEGIEDFPVDALQILKRKLAEKIATDAEAILMKHMQIVKKISTADKTGFSLGYTSVIQETSARSEYVRRFEFNCWQLAQFKRKYLQPI